ncbi:MAG: sulfite exporter TauE/SafE family protein, partial [Hyphomonadaceae bacterium]|nr:sulfite exporter TauE/SafE family protein [Hyphomonadaceae bacterium]
AAIAIPAALGYAIVGFGREGLPPWSVGFVNLAGFVFLALLTMTTAPIGARLAHRLPQLTLKRTFALVLAVLALNMLREAFS